MLRNYGIILMACVLWSFGLPKHIQKKINKEIKAVYNIESYELHSKNFDIQDSVRLLAKFGDFNLFTIQSETNLIGYAYLGKALSKTDDFDYLILFDQNFVIKKTKVLIYREDYGGEIGSKRWLRQFEGKTQNDDLKLHQNIIAISGATISVRSMTNAINDVLRSIRILHQKQML